MARVGAVAFLVILLCDLVMAQFDPGARDTVYFCGAQSYVYGPPYSGHILIEVCFFNDENLLGIQVPLRWTGDAQLDAGIFTNTRVDTAYLKKVTLDANNEKVLIEALATPGQAVIEPGQGTLVWLMGTVMDTGLVKLDSTTFSSFSLRFVPEYPIDIVPVFEALEFEVRPDSIMPGDVDASDEVNLQDIMVIVNHVFRGIPISYGPVADVNADCRINLADVITLVNYIFRSGTQPVPGCAWDLGPPQ